MPRPEEERLKRIKKNLMRRALILEGIREYFRDNDFLEIDTPLRVPQVAPEVNIAPFLSEECFLSTSPELYMKRLLAAGYDKIFQLTRSFRRGERGRLHQPEFTILEWYRIYSGYAEVMQDTENLVLSITRKLGGDNSISYRGQIIDLSVPWVRLTVSDAFNKFAGWDPSEAFDPDRFETDLVDKVLPAFPTNRPVILTEYPAYTASLSRLKPGDASVAERAEAFIGGLEIANAFSELVDPEEQEKRFKEDIESLKKAGKDYYKLPERFLEAIKTMPPAGGIAVGVDRLVMLFCDADRIDDVLAFPWMEETGLEA
jgi:elongation factor P--(R)-beta-lysine ligase